MTKRSIALLVLLLATSSVTPLVAEETPRVFTPETGFAGVTKGQGSLKLLFGERRPFRVESRGTIQGDGTFRLDQTVTFNGGAPKTRSWIISTTAPGRYSATLSDSSGPVSGRTTGSVLSLRYRVKGLLVMHQTLELAADGQTIENIGVIRLLGVPVGRMRETIQRQSPDITAETTPQAQYP